MDYLKINQATWNRRTEIHLTSKFYDVEGFLEGNNVLNSIEINELGDVAGKSLLHLQCHFGLDTLSWARLGADVTGVDLSSTAIDKANMLAKKAELKANFINADVYAFGEQAKQQFDIVFTSYGAICWLPDIDLWAQTVAKSLKPGGTFYMVEFHPLYDVLSGYSYFHRDEPDVEEESTYTENDGGETATTVVWSHPISDVINALIKVGIQIESLNEFPYSPYQCFENMIEHEPGKYIIEHKGQMVPLLYSVKGKKLA